MIKKYIFVIIGGLLFVLGTIGIFVPIVPTTPFYLLSAYFWGKSSEKFHSFLLKNKICGGYLKDFHEKKGITLRNKINILTLLSMSIGFSMFKLESLHLRIFLGVVFIGVTFHILKIRTLR